MKILCINPGSTSTRIAVFDEDKKVFITNITHANEDLCSGGCRTEQRGRGKACYRHHDLHLHLLMLRQIPNAQVQLAV